MSMTIEEKRRTCSYCQITFKTKEEFGKHFNSCFNRIEARHIKPTVEYYNRQGVFLVESQTYRSLPFVNMTDNRVRVTLDMPRNVWHRLKNTLCLFNKEELKVLQDITHRECEKNEKK